jgi:hypothetical protein
MSSVAWNKVGLIFIDGHTLYNKCQSYLLKQLNSIPTLHA